jgi:hypothetical protein
MWHQQCHDRYHCHPQLLQQQQGSSHEVMPAWLYPCCGFGCGCGSCCACGQLLLLCCHHHCLTCSHCGCEPCRLRAAAAAAAGDDRCHH